MNPTSGASAGNSLGNSTAGIGCEHPHGIIAALEKPVERQT